MEVTLIDNELKMSSRDIAERTEKQHKHVLEDIRKMLEELGLECAEFSATYVHEQNKQEYEEFLLPKRECLILVSGYNIHFRAKIIDRWQELELNSPTLTFEEMAKKTIAMADIRIKALETQIKEDKPRVEFAKTIEGSSEKILIGDLSKLTDGKIGRNRLFRILKDKKILMNDNIPYQQYLDRGYFEVTERIIKSVKKDIISFTTYVTGKGQVWLLDKINAWV